MGLQQVLEREKIKNSQLTFFGDYNSGLKECWKKWKSRKVIFTLSCGSDHKFKWIDLIWFGMWYSGFLPSITIVVLQIYLYLILNWMQARWNNAISDRSNIKEYFLYLTLILAELPSQNNTVHPCFISLLSLSCRWIEKYILFSHHFLRVARESSFKFFTDWFWFRTFISGFHNMHFKPTFKADKVWRRIPE